MFGRYIKGESAAGIPYWVYGSFFVGAVCSISSVAWSVSKTPEIAPTAEELAEMKAHHRGVFTPFIEIAGAIKDMPKILKQLGLVYLFQWYALFCYWQYISHSIAASVYHTSAEQNKQLYEEAAQWTGLVNGFYNVVTFLSAFGLVWLAKKYSAKWLHALCLAAAAVSLFILPHIENKYFLFAPMIGFGVAWASMMGVPYIMVISSIPKSRYGVYMGIINMMIVIPMILQTLSFGFVYKHFLGSSPQMAITFAGALLLIASVCTTFISYRRPTEEGFNMAIGAEAQQQGI